MRSGYMGGREKMKVADVHAVAVRLWHPRTSANEGGQHCQKSSRTSSGIRGGEYCHWRNFEAEGGRMRLLRANLILGKLVWVCKPGDSLLPTSLQLLVVPT